MIKIFTLIFLSRALVNSPTSHFLPLSPGNEAFTTLKMINQTNSGIALAVSDNFYQNISQQVKKIKLKKSFFELNKVIFY